jgi:hypothetical protein
MMESDPNSPRVLRNFRSDVEAALVVGRLQSLGINARISGAGGATGWPEALGYTQVVVRKADLERALAAIQEPPAHTPEPQ